VRLPRATRRTQLDHGTQCSAFVRKFPALLVDEPPEVGGNNAGMNPVELLLVALGACQEIAYSLFASTMGIELDAVTVNLKGQLDFRGTFGLDESIPPGYQKITYETRLDSQANPESIQALIKTVEARCPTMDTLTRPVDVQGDVYLNGEPVTT
jgi:uncharacterized OsmC-like protein